MSEGRFQMNEQLERTLAFNDGTKRYRVVEAKGICLGSNTLAP